MHLTVHTLKEIDVHLGKIHEAAAKTHAWLRAHEGEPLELLRALKFDRVGFHPVMDHPLNVIEQVNQTFTYAVALAAARELFTLHPEAGDFALHAVPTHRSRFDIMSIEKGLVGAETAAVTPANNNKLNKDLIKLASRPEKHRYVFFSSPLYPKTRRLPKFERDEVQVWSVDV